MIRHSFFPKNLWDNFHSLKGIIKSLGLVFGDLGTSPTYTLTVIFLTLPATPPNIIGVLSLICWTLILLVFVEYAFLAMSLSKKGEGGTVVLKEILVPLLKKARHVTFASWITYIGISLLIGDGILTPVMNILSACEGIKLLPPFQSINQGYLLVLACFLALLLFIFQKKGSDTVSMAFGPIMLVWFTILAVVGFFYIMQEPFILHALNPWSAIKFMIDNGLLGFFVLSEIILCATGGEALYSDMGHLGRKPIRNAGYFVLISLLLSYLGQGAFLLNNPSSKYIFYQLMYGFLNHLYIPFILLNFAASIIASQAMISGIFSIIYQGITTKILPKLKIEYTSTMFRSQIYISFVNWSMFTAVVCLIFFFKTSSNLAAAYGFAVTGTMSVTGIMMSLVFYLRKQYSRTVLSIIITFIDLIFLISNTYKIPNGGYVSVILACIPLTFIIIFTKGQSCLAQALKPTSLEDFLEKYKIAYRNTVHIKGTALFFCKDLTTITPFITQTMFKNNIQYEDNILVTVITRDDPFGVIGFFKGELAPGLRIFEIHMGYLEVIDAEKILHNAGINAKVIFYGVEEIVTTKLPIKVYALIKKITPSFVQFYKLPPYKLHGVVTLVEI